MMSRFTSRLFRAALVGTALLTSANAGPPAGGRAGRSIREFLIGAWKAVDESAVKGGPVILGFDRNGSVCEWGVSAERHPDAPPYDFDPFHREGGVTYKIDTTRTPPVLVVSHKDILGDPVTQDFEIVGRTARTMTLGASHFGQLTKVTYAKVSDDPRHFHERRKRRPK